MSGLKAQFDELFDSWSVSLPAGLALRSQCLPEKIGRSKKAQYRWILILALSVTELGPFLCPNIFRLRNAYLLSLIRAMHLRDRETTSSLGSTGDNGVARRTQASLWAMSGIRKLSSSTIR